MKSILGFERDHVNQRNKYNSNANIILYTLAYYRKLEMCQNAIERTMMGKRLLDRIRTRTLNKHTRTKENLNGNGLEIQSGGRIL